MITPPPDMDIRTGLQEPGFICRLLGDHRWGPWTYGGSQIYFRDCIRWWSCDVGQIASREIGGIYAELVERGRDGR